MTIILIVASAFFTGLMFYKMIWPWLGQRLDDDSVTLDDEMRQLEELVVQKALLMQNLRELEFDLELEKISQEDYVILKRRYEQQTIGVMRKLDALHGGRDWEAKIEQELIARLKALQAPEEKAPAKTKAKKTKKAKAAAPVIEAVEAAAVVVEEPATSQEEASLHPCPDCGKMMEVQARFCSQCGATLNLAQELEAASIQQVEESKEVRS